MRTLLAMAATSLLVLAGCSATDEPEPEPAPTPTSTAPVESTETAIALGEPFTIAGPNYTANVTIERIYLPAQCGEYSNANIAVEVDVEVETGDGTREVLNTGTVRERDPDGYITRDRTVSTTCGDIEELEARNVQSGDKYRGVRWLQEDVNPKSEILIGTPTSQGTPIAEVFVLDLAEFDIQPAPTTSEQPTAVPAPPAAAPAQPVPPAAEPYVVECLFGAPGPSRMSDGTIQSTDYCANQPGAAESRYLESNCSDMAWRQGMGLEGDRLCGSSLFEDGALWGN